MKSFLFRGPHRGSAPSRFLLPTGFFAGFLTVGLALPALNGLATSGTVTFANHDSSKVINGYTTNPVTAGNGVKAALYWSPLGTNDFTQIGAVTTVGIPVAGIFSAGTRTNGSATPGGAIGQFQVRAWSGAATNYAQALAIPGILIGQSAILQVPTGDPAGDPPTPPGSLVAGGLTSFTILSNGFSPLVLSCASNKTVQCGNIWSFDPPTISGGCISNPVVTVISTVTNGFCSQTITRTWQATDGCGNSNSCSQTVIVPCTNCPVLVVTKTCPPNAVPPGGFLTFTGTVTNVSDVTLTNVVVLNDKPSPATLVYGPATLPPGTGDVFSGSYTVAGCAGGSFTNTLTATGVGPGGVVFSNSFTASCPIACVFVPGDSDGDGIVDQNELNAVLSNYWAHSEWIYMTNPASLGNGVFEFALTNSTGWNFTVQASTNLTNWVNLPAPAYPLYQFVDPDATNLPERYYRLRWP